MGTQELAKERKSGRFQGYGGGGGVSRASQRKRVQGEHDPNLSPRVPAAACSGKMVNVFPARLSSYLLNASTEIKNTQIHLISLPKKQETVSTTLRNELKPE